MPYRRQAGETCGPNKIPVLPKSFLDALKHPDDAGLRAELLEALERFDKFAGTLPMPTLAPVREPEELGGAAAIPAAAAAGAGGGGGVPPPLPPRVHGRLLHEECGRWTLKKATGYCALCAGTARVAGIALLREAVLDDWTVDTEETMAALSLVKYLSAKNCARHQRTWKAALDEFATWRTAHPGKRSAAALATARNTCT